MEKEYKIRYYYKLIRLEKEITLKKLANKLYISVSKLSEFENGKYNLDLETRNNLENYLDINKDQLEEFFIIDGLKMNEYFIEINKDLIYFSDNLFEKIDKLNNYKDKLKKTLDYPYYFIIQACFTFAKSNNIKLCQYYYNKIKVIFNYFNTDEQKIFLTYYSIVFYKKKKYTTCMLFIKKIDERYQQSIQSDTIKNTFYMFCCNNLGKWEESKKILDYETQQAIEMKNCNRYASLLLTKSVIYGLKGEFSQALKVSLNNIFYIKQYNLFQHEYPILSNIGYYYFCLGDYIKAITFLDLAQNINSPCSFQDEYAYFLMAFSYFLLQLYNQSREYIEKAKKTKIKEYAISKLVLWLEAMLNKSYSKKCETLLLASLSGKRTTINKEVEWMILELLINHYTHTKNIDKQHQYILKLNNSKKDLNINNFTYFPANNI